MNEHLERTLVSYGNSRGWDLTAAEVLTRVTEDLAYNWALNGWRAGSNLSEEDKDWVLTNITPQ